MVIAPCSIALVLGLSGAGDIALEVEAPRVSYFSGQTLYEIEGVDGLGSWRSRLKFPASSVAVGGGVGLLFGGQAELRLRGWTTADRAVGTMRDDDWSDGVRDIWSRSNAELDAWGLSGEATWWALRTPIGELGPRVRIDYDRLDYDIENVRQWGLDPDDNAAVDGLVLTYRQERLSVLPGLAGALRPLGWLEMGAFIGMSPWTYVWDEDDHVLRYKASELETIGIAFFTEAHVDFVLADHARLGLWGEFLQYDSWWGSQDQRFYAGPDRGLEFNNIDGEIHRQTYMLGARFALDF